MKLTTTDRCVAARCVLAIRHADKPIERVAAACKLAERLIRNGRSQHYALSMAEAEHMQ